MANFHEYVIFLGWKKCVSKCKVCFPANESTTFVNSKIEKINYTVQMLKKPKKNRVSSSSGYKGIKVTSFA
jgi:hypothetical protein